MLNCLLVVQPPCYKWTYLYIDNMFIYFGTYVRMYVYNSIYLKVNAHLHANLCICRWYANIGGTFVLHRDT